MTLFPRLGAAAISTVWPFRYSLLVKTPVSIASALGQSGTGMTSLNLISSSELSDDCMSKFTSCEN